MRCLSTPLLFPSHEKQRKKATNPPEERVPSNPHAAPHITCFGISDFVKLLGDYIFYCCEYIKA